AAVLPATRAPSARVRRAYPDKCAARRTATRCDRAGAASARRAQAMTRPADARSFRSGEHLLQPLDEEGRAFHDARLLALHQRPDLRHIGLPVGIGRPRRAALFALVNA